MKAEKVFALAQAGNVSLAQFVDQSFVASANLSGPQTIKILNGSWYYTDSFSHSACASFVVSAEAPVNIFVITTAAFSLLVSQFQTCALSW